MQNKQLGINTILFGLGVTIPLFVEKILVHPFLMREMGESAFGEFVVALAIVMMIAIIPSNSTTQTLLREHARHSGDNKELFFRTCFFTNIFVLLVLFAIALFFSDTIGKLVSKTDGNTGGYIRSLSVYGILFGSIPLLQGFFRVRLEFKNFLAIGTGLGVGALAVIPLVSVYGTDGIGFLYCLCALGGVVVGMVLMGGRIAALPLINIAEIPTILRISMFFSGGAVLALLQTYMARIYLGAAVEPALISQFFAANSIALIFGEPASVVGRVAFSYLARWKRIEDCPRKFFLRHIIITIGIIATMGLAALLLGKFVFTLIYPTVVAVSYPLFLVRIFGRMAASVRSLLFGWVSKFMAPWTNSVVVAICLVVNMSLLVLLVKPLGVMGAAVACTTSDILVGISYALLIAPLYFRTNRPRGKQEQPL